MPLKIAHFAPFAPMACGLYEAARDMVRADREAGREADFVDLGPVMAATGQRAPAGKFGTRDERDGFTLEAVPFDRVVGHDLFVMHDGVPDAMLAKTQAPLVLIMHGRPIDCFRPEYQGRSKTDPYTFFANFATWPRVKRMVNLWAEHVPYWETLVPPEKLRLVDHPCIDQMHFRPEGPKHGFKPEEGGAFNVMIADSWRETEPYPEAHGALLAGRELPGFKLHFYAMEEPLRCWEHLVKAFARAGLRGEFAGRVGKMETYYRAVDLVVTGHAIATRVLAEAMSCGTPVVAPRPCRWTPWTFNANDPADIARAIVEAHREISSDRAGVRARTLETAKAFAPARFARDIGRIYEEVLAEGRPAWPGRRSA